MNSENGYRQLIKHILLAFLAAVSLLMIFYLSVFHGGLSRDSSDWANLGAYIGGILTPLVSFAALIAIIRTISIQKQLLDVQRDEFDNLLTAHNRQLQISEATYKENVLVSYKGALITALEQKMALLQSHREQADMAIRLASTANTATSQVGARAAGTALAAQKKVKTQKKSKS